MACSICLAALEDSVYRFQEAHHIAVCSGLLLRQFITQKRMKPKLSIPLAFLLGLGILFAWFSGTSVSDAEGSRILASDSDTDEIEG